MRKQIANEIIRLMSSGGPYPGLWTGEPMNVEQVIEHVQQHQSLPMLNGHTKNSLEMQNVRHKIYRRITKLSHLEEA